MFQSRRFSKKICGQSKTNVVIRTLPITYYTKILLLCGLAKITSACHTLESVPEKTIVEIRTVYPAGSKHQQCYNMPSKHKLAFQISTYLPQQNMSLNEAALASILEEYSHYAHLFKEELKEGLRKMEFSINKRTQVLLAAIIKDNHHKLLKMLFPYLLSIILTAKILGYKTVLLIIFTSYMIQPTQAKPTTIQNLYKTLAFVQLRKISDWLTFTEDEYHAMETGLIDAIRQLRKTETQTTPQPTTTTEIPRTNNELLQGILHSFIKRSDEREETKQQEQQEMIYATE
jgi:hypothetical protein